jgi:lysophospholipase L1-like esterase
MMGNEKWIATWGTSQQLVEPHNLPPEPGLANTTIRQVFRVSLGGRRCRFRFSNRYGTKPVELNAVHIAKALNESSILPSSDKSLMFNGKLSVTIPAGEEVYCDAFDFSLAPLDRLAVSIWIKDISNVILTGHPGSRTTSYIQTGNCLCAPVFENPIMTDHWYIICGLDLLLDDSHGALVVIGDSITDGRGTTTNGNDRWTDFLAERLLSNPSTNKISVINQGLGGNTILLGGLGPSAQSRFDHDVLEQPGVRWAIVLEGVNDVGNSETHEISKSLIEAYKEFIDKARTKNIKIFGSPILPLTGHDYGSDLHESTRQTINEWIRHSGNFDACIDLDAAVRDPDRPQMLLPLYDCGDHLHLSPAGYRKLGESVDLGLFEDRDS